MPGILDRLTHCIESVKRWSEWPDEGDIGCLVEAKAEIERLRSALERIRDNPEDPIHRSCYIASRALNGMDD